MDKLTPNPDAIVNVEGTPESQTSAKGAWVTPVVREYDPADVTKAFINFGGADGGIYS